LKIDILKSDWCKIPGT